MDNLLKDIHDILDNPPQLEDLPSKEITTLDEAKTALDDIKSVLDKIDLTLVTQNNVNEIKAQKTSLTDIKNFLAANQDIVTNINDEDAEKPASFKPKLKLVDEKVDASIALINRLEANVIPDLPLNSPFFISFVAVGGLCVILVLFGFVCICIINSSSLAKKVKPKKKVGKAKKAKKGKTQDEDLWIGTNPNGTPYRGDMERQIS